MGKDSTLAEVVVKLTLVSSFKTVNEKCLLEIL